MRDGLWNVVERVDLDLALAICVDVGCAGRGEGGGQRRHGAVSDGLGAVNKTTSENSGREHLHRQRTEKRLVREPHRSWLPSRSQEHGACAEGGY